MPNWVGFSDEELRRMKQDIAPIEHDPPQVNAHPTRGRPSTTRGRTPPPRGRPFGAQSCNPQSRNPASHSASSNLPPETRLSQHPPQPRQQQRQQAAPQCANEKPPPQTVQAKDDVNTPKTLAATPSVSRVCGDAADGICNTQTTEEKEEKDENIGMVIDDKDIIIQEFQNLEKFQFQQKRIEEQNKMKRQLLASAISERQKRAKQEATRLTHIQKELAQLDQLLAIDVSIIRNKIEEASREYMDAQRRHERAEREFIESKLDLHHKCEFKDSLTEHLHMVIHQNEVRKARKLTDLMAKLSMEDGSESEVAEELALPTTTGFLMTSIQNAQEQRRMLERSRRTSEGAGGGIMRSPGLKRSGSEGSGAADGGGGVTGWISSWIMGSGSTGEDYGKNGVDGDGFKRKTRVGSVISTAPVTTAGKEGALQPVASLPGSPSAASPLLAQNVRTLSPPTAGSELQSPQLTVTALPTSTPPQQSRPSECSSHPTLAPNAETPPLTDHEALDVSKTPTTAASIEQSTPRQATPISVQEVTSSTSPVQLSPPSESKPDDTGASVAQQKAPSSPTNPEASLKNPTDNKANET